MRAVLEHFGLSGPPLGEGGEAQVWALDEARVLRVWRGGGFDDQTERRKVLHDDLQPGARAAGIAIPDVLETGETDGQYWTVESRLPGRPLSVVLEGDCDREALVSGYMETAIRLGDLLGGTTHREICHEAPLSSDNGPTFLRLLAERSLTASPLDIPAPDPGLGDGPVGLVHMDYYPSNLMATETEITGVLDFGYGCFLSDRRLTPLVAAVALSRYVTPGAREADRAFAVRWLEARELGHLTVKVQPWIAAYWAFAMNDEPVVERWIPAMLEGRGLDED
ncbi:phosphotransferase [Pelagovum pacificum]|uniref:Aminoglycoside phosphotransferase domain-containing protein n=1 Tax=Pelagovum pacificum TaxID=2588711 RepID=A0A5C5GGN1_9RHOB|nr:phosphotransferase [Pelagovum pacificum]QQA43002.1 phosphotransferase [Pelagovum pacificum]TNY33853.1 hypothetical protein FHY64_11495 [Pelagovum pacificum]